MNLNNDSVRANTKQKGLLSTIDHESNSIQNCSHYKLKQRLPISALSSGIFIFGLCMLGSWTNSIALLLITTYLLPGLAFGLLVAYYIASNTPYWKVFTLVFLFSAIYTGLVFLIKLPDGENKIVALRLIAASSIGALATSLTYQILMVGKIIRKKSLLQALIFGFIASLPCAVFCYFLDEIAYDDKVLENLLWAGIFSIYPLWYFLIALHLRGKNLKAQ